jgi:hypothetical protein
VPEQGRDEERRGQRQAVRRGARGALGQHLQGRGGSRAGPAPSRVVRCVARHCWTYPHISLPHPVSHSGAPLEKERRASGNAFPPLVANVFVRRYEIELASPGTSTTVPIVMPYANTFHVTCGISDTVSDLRLRRLERVGKNRQMPHYTGPSRWANGIPPRHPVNRRRSVAQWRRERQWDRPVGGCAA